MKQFSHNLRLATLMAAVIFCSGAIVNSDSWAEDAASPPKVGSKAPGFELKDLSSGKKISLKEKLEKTPVVLVVLRGFPGYQCPICSRQVGGLIQNSEAISNANASVVMVYPGLGNQLEQRAKEFFSRHKLPSNFTVVTDPDYRFTNSYHLRWDAPRETAYPSTFVIGKDGKVVHVHISKGHGNRTNPKEIVKALGTL